MEKGYRVNGHVVQFLDVMCGDAWKKKGYHGPVICNYADGSEYQGEWKDGKRHGIGTYISPTGTRYEGEWGNDGASGHGVCHYADGMKYDGEFEGGERHGKGTLVSTEGDRYEGQFKNDLVYMAKEFIHGAMALGRKVNSEKENLGMYWDMMNTVKFADCLLMERSRKFIQGPTDVQPRANIKTGEQKC